MGLGDELMAAGEAQSLSKSFGNCKVAILDKTGLNVRQHELWDNNPHIAKPGEKFTKSIVNGPDRRGYIEAFKTNKWTWRAYNPIPAEMFFYDSEKKFADSIGEGFVVIGPTLLNRTEDINRNWGWGNFADLIRMFPNADWVQLGPKGTKILPGSRLIQTSTPRMATAALTKAHRFVSHEGGMHHMAAAVGLKGVVIYGGFTSEHVSGYSIHRHISVGPGLGCGSRIKCKHCSEAMKSITPSRVASELTQCFNM